MQVSVIIPSFNEEKYLDATLYHIAAQKPYEIIVSDSYSTDRTVRIAKKYGARVVLVPRGNISRARNVGARAATGDIFLFLDADTITFPNLVATLQKDFRKRRIAGWTCSFYAFSPKVSDHLAYFSVNNFADIFAKVGKAHAPGFVLAVRREVFEKLGGFDESLKAMEDHDLAMKVCKHGDFTFSRHTCVFTSARRLNRWGFWKILKKYSRIYVTYFLNKKKIRNISYPPVR